MDKNTLNTPYADYSKNNPLYKYVPDRMRLVSVNENPAITVYGFEKPTEQRSGLIPIRLIVVMDITIGIELIWIS